MPIPPKPTPSTKPPDAVTPTSPEMELTATEVDAAREEVKRYLTRFDTTEKVFERARKLGIKGRPRRTDACLVQRLIEKETGVRNKTFGTFVEIQGSAESIRTRYLNATLTLPVAVMEAIKLFDLEPHSMRDLIEGSDSVTLTPTISTDPTT